jgi:hypothetical protein
MARGSDGPLSVAPVRGNLSLNDHYADALHSQRDRDAMHLQQHRHAVQNLDVDIRQVGREQVRVLAGGLSAFCSEDDTILRTPRLAYNFHNSSRLLVWARD